MSYLLGQMEATRIIGMALREGASNARADSKIARHPETRGDILLVASILDRLGDGFIAASGVMEAKMRSQTGEGEGNGGN